MKLTVMICEDLEEERMTLARMVRKCCADRRVDLELELTSSGEELLDRFRSRRWDVIFLDIYMDGMTGVAAARKIRETDHDTLIVFLTTSQDHAFDSFDVHAYQYILKSPDDAALKSAVCRVVDEIASITRPVEEQKLTFSVNGTEQSVLFPDILFATSEKNYIQITDRAQNSYRTRMTFSEVVSLLGKDSRFLQINRGVVINMDCITAFGKDSCELCGGYSLPVNVREQKKLDQIRKNYVFSKLHSRSGAGGTGL